MKICPVCERTFGDDASSCPDCGSTLIREGGDGLIGRAFKDTYVVEQKIGAGAMGAVYRATQRPLGRAVAIKVINAATGEDGLIKRFFREAQVMSQLIHPNVVHVIDFGNTEDRLAYMVMECLHGETLDSVVTEGRGLPLPFVQAAMEQICAGVGAAHGQGMIHRDLKPSNIFLARMSDGSQVVKILDFGLAKVLGGSANNQLTQAGMLMGTPGYIAPEQISDPSKADARSDIYALGAIMVYMLTGRDAYQGATVQLTLAMQIAKPPAKIWMRDLGVPDNLCPLVVKLMDPDPALRLQSTDEVLQELRKATGMSVTRLPAVAAASASSQSQSSSGVNKALDTPAGGGDAGATKVMSQDEIDSAVAREANERKAVSPPSEADVFLPENSTKPPAPADNNASGSLMQPLDMDNLERQAAKVGEEVERRVQEETKRREDADLAKPSFLDSLSGGLKDEGEVGHKPASAVDQEGKVMSGGLKPEPAEEPPVSPTAKTIIDDEEPELALPTENLPTATKEELDAFNPHSSGEVPLIAPLGSFDTASTQSSDAIPAAGVQPGVAASGPSALQQSGEKVVIAPNQKFQPLELAPDPEEERRRYEEEKKKAQRASSKVDVPIAPAGGVDVFDDPRFKIGAGAAAGLLLLMVVYLIFFSGPTEEKPKPDAAAQKAVQEARRGAVAKMKAYQKQFGETDITPPDEYESAKAKMTEALRARNDEKLEASKAAYDEAAGLYDQAIGIASKSLAGFQEKLGKESTTAATRWELADKLYKNQDLTDRAALLKGKESLEEAVRLKKNQKIRASVAAYTKANKHLLEAIKKAQESLGGLSGEAKEAQARAMAARRKYLEVFQGTDLDEPTGVAQAKAALADGDKLIEELKYDKAKDAFVDAESFYIQAHGQAKEQEHQLKRRYGADEKAARADAAGCKKAASFDRLTAPPEWAQGQRELEKAEQLVERRQFKAAAKAWAEVRRTLANAKKKFNVEAREVAAESNRKARGVHLKAKAKYEPTDVPPPPQFREGKVSESAAAAFEKDGLYIDAIVRFEKAHTLFTKVFEEADAVIGAARKASEAARQDAMLKKSKAVKRIRGREPLPKGPDQLVDKGDGEMKRLRLIGSRETYQQAAKGFVQALADFEARLLAKKKASEAVRRKALAAGKDAGTLVGGVDEGQKARAAQLIADGNALFPSEKFDEAKILFAKAEGVYRAAIAVAFVARGDGRLSAEKYADARRDFDNAIQQDARNARGWHGRGMARYYLDETNKAISDFDKAIALDDQYAESYFGRGACYAEKGNNGRAMTDLDKAVQLDPKHWRAHRQRGLIYKQQGNKGQARTALRAAWTHAPSTAKTEIWNLLRELGGN